MQFRIIIAVLISLSFGACSQKTALPLDTTSTFYEEQIKTWRSDRVKNLTAPTGWLSLVGLYWLNEGGNSFGANPTNALVFPAEAPNYMGSFLLEKGTVTMKIKTGISVKVADEEVKDVVLESDVSGSPTVATIGAISWYLLQRGEDRFGIRVRNSTNEAIKKFEGIPYYAINADWNIPATLRPAGKEKTITLRNVVDMDVEMKLEGYLVFEKDGNTYELEAMDGGKDSYFVIFADETTGMETYGGGRYIYVPRVDDAGKTLIDFNKAHNPPCAFTDFATCPLPSAKNQLTLTIEAGEKKYH